MLEWIIRNSFLGITVVEEEVGSVNRSLSRQILILTTWSSNHFSRYFVDKTEKDVIEVMREFEKLSKQGKSFVLVYEKKILSGRADAYLHSMASNLMIIKTELAAERVSRMLYIPKMVGEGPLDKLIKITVDGAGVQEDT